MNKVILVGKLASEPVRMVSELGTCRCAFALEVDSQDDAAPPVFIPIDMFCGRSGPRCARMGIGDRCKVRGKLTREWSYLPGTPMLRLGLRVTRVTALPRARLRRAAE